MKMQDYKNIDEYISNFPTSTQEILKKIRKVVHDAAPSAQEKISYGIPTLTFRGNLLHFAGYDHHIGFYPGAQTIADFEHELKDYVTSKGTVQFPLDKPIPYDLINAMSVHRVQLANK